MTTDNHRENVVKGMLLEMFQGRTEKHVPENVLGVVVDEILKNVMRFNDEQVVEYLSNSSYVNDRVDRIVRLI